MRTVFTRLAAAVLTTAAAGLGAVAAPAPAEAAGCSGSSGVTVVVDPGSLGGGVATACSGSGGNAASLFTGAGFALTYVQRQPGFVCRIDGRPASDPCVNTPPADAYWGLWWSDGRTGSWTYAATGAGSLSVPDGGYVGFAWQGGSRTPPGVPATPRASAPSPTQPPHTSPTPTSGPSPKPTTKPSTRPSSGPTPAPTSQPTSQPSSQPGAGGPPSGTPTTVPTPSPTAPPTTAAPDQTSAAASGTVPASPGTVPTTAPPTGAASPTDASSGSGTPASEAAPVEEDGTLPVWAVPLVLAVLLAGGLAAYLLRRRHRSA